MNAQRPSREFRLQLPGLVSPDRSESRLHKAIGFGVGDLHQDETIVNLPESELNCRSRLIEVVSLVVIGQDSELNGHTCGSHAHIPFPPNKGQIDQWKELLSRMNRADRSVREGATAAHREREPIRGLCLKFCHRLFR